MNSIAFHLSQSKTNCTPRKVFSAILLALVITSSLHVSGQQPGTKRWGFATQGEIHSSPAIAPDGTIYVGSWDARLYAVNRDGTKKWEFLTGNRINSSPAIGADGTIYVGSDDNNLYAVGEDGKERWRFPTGNAVFTDPAISGDGTIYVTSDDGNLYAVNSNGSKKWQFATGGRVPSPAIAGDGTIYTGTTTGFIHALNSDGSSKWKYKSSRGFTGGSTPSPHCIIDADGSIVANPTASAGYFERILPDGTFKQSLINIFVSAPLSIGPSGVLYGGNGSGQFHAVFSNFSLRWKFSLPRAQTPGTLPEVVFGAPAVAADGTVYFGVEGGIVYALDSDGKEKWKANTGGRYLSNPAIGRDGTIYVGSDDKTLYALYGASGLSTGPWPMYRRDTKHTGAVPNPVLSQTELGLGMYPGITIKGNVANSYRIEFSTDAGDPKNWQSLATVTLDRTPFFFVDVNAANVTKRFYRAVLLP